MAASGAAVAAMLVVLAAGAAEKFVIALPNGYEMARARSGAVAIEKRRGKVVVPGSIRSYAVLREVVVGELDVPPPKEAEPPASPSAPAGKPAANPVFTRPPPSPSGRYFVLDTKTGEVGKDLSLAEWEAQLKKLDITSAPALAAPILPK